jgi:hypothetical protein
MWEKGTVVPTLGGQLVPRAITKALMKVLPSAFLRHFMGGSTVFFPLAPKVGAVRAVGAAACGAGV